MKLFKALTARAVYAFVSLFVISFITFIANEAMPDPAIAVAGDKASLETVQRIRENLGLNKPWYIRYGTYLSKATHGDFGTSYFGTKEDVSDIIKRSLPTTILLAGWAIILATVIGVFLGVIAALFQNGPPDRAALLVSTLFVTVPNFLLAPLLVLLFSLKLGWLPINWDTDSNWKAYVLPICVLAARPTAMLTRLTRAAVVDTFQQEFVRLAVAKGVPPARLLFRHVLRNSSLPVVTAIGTNFGLLLTGSFVTETYFTLPGLGRQTITAITQGDGPTIQACVLLTGALFILVNLIVDIILPLLDPRIREAQI